MALTSSWVSVERDRPSSDRISLILLVTLLVANSLVQAVGVTGAGGEADAGAAGAVDTAGGGDGGAAADAPSAETAGTDAGVETGLIL